ncbi:MAG TPA: Fe-S cluster assembly protein SufD [Vicinamibacterales bacterium]|nr:Fe-S cluster assembly protein SufD [Vicinamibacterales bacterium]
MTQIAEKRSSLMSALDRRPQGGPRWLETLRAQAASRFAALGVPTVRDEEWRFTNAAPIASAGFELAADVPVSTAEVDGLPYGTAPLRLVLVNGRIDRALSRLDTLPRGVVATSLAEAIDTHADIVERYLGRAAVFQTRSFVALNTALANDGAFVYVPDGLAVEPPLQLLCVSAAGDRPSMNQPRVLVVAGAGSQVRLAETYVGAAGEVYFTNGVTEVFAGENAVVDHYKVQHDSFEAFHVGSMHVNLSRSATFSSHSFAVGGRFVRNDVVAVLDGEGGECTLNGLYLADGERLVDTHTEIDHARAHCASHEVYKGILGGTARAVFNGKIVVRPDAQKTDAKQTNRALLLSDGATINTKPQLEIFADDVKCTHGAAIGQLDDDAIFYLRARGLTFAEARDMLIHAFAGDILARVKIDALRAALEAELFAQLARDLEEAVA